MMPELTGVPAFVHVAEQRSFREAARILGVTPTAVSKSVGRLEERLGCRLLHRTSRFVGLTSEGEVYLRHCRDALDRLQAGEDELTRVARVANGLVKVSVSRVMGRAVVAGLRALHARHPGIRVAWSFTDREVALAEEEVDVAVRIGELPDSGLVARRLRTPRWLTVASPDYLARAGHPADWRDLAGHDVLRFARPDGGVTDPRFRVGERLEALRGPSACVMDQGDLLVEAAAEGLGVLQAFDFMVADRLESGALVEILAQRAPPGPPMHALTLAGRHRVPKVRAVLDFLSLAFGVSPSDRGPSP